ncbi:MAG: hypothetical protein WBG36_17400 [Ornithinimicrobium sp.]
MTAAAMSPARCSPLSGEVTLVLQDETRPTEEETLKLEARGVAVVDGPVTELVEGDRLQGVRLSNGKNLAAQALVVGPGADAPRRIPTSRGLP